MRQRKHYTIRKQAVAIRDLARPEPNSAHWTLATARTILTDLDLAGALVLRYISASSGVGRLEAHRSCQPKEPMEGPTGAAPRLEEALLVEGIDDLLVNCCALH